MTTTTLLRLLPQQSARRFACCGLIIPATLPVLALLFGGIATLFGEQPPPEATAFWMQIALGAVVFGVGGALWARALFAALGLPVRRRQLAAGALGVSAAITASIGGLGALEPVFVERRLIDMPVHHIYSVLFVTATFIGAFVAAWPIARSVLRARRASAAAAHSALGAATAFLAANVVQDLLGRRVGAPNAEASATMITVTLLCVTFAAAAGSAVLGLKLARWAGAMPAGAERV